MRAVFGVVSLLLVLAVVGWTATSQLHAVKALAPAAGASATPAEAAKQMQQQVARDVNAALQQGAARNDAAEAANSEKADK